MNGLTNLPEKGNFILLKIGQESKSPLLRPCAQCIFVDNMEMKMKGTSSFDICTLLWEYYSEG